MKEVARVFDNELGNTIEMRVIDDERGITVYAKGPKSEVEHTWTPLEAKNLRELLNFEYPSQT